MIRFKFLLSSLSYKAVCLQNMIKKQSNLHFWNTCKKSSNQIFIKKYYQNKIFHNLTTARHSIIPNIF